MREAPFELVSAALEYNPDTGIFKRKVGTSHNAPKGAIAGCKTPMGYIIIGVGNKSFLAHRLAWLLMTGNWPKKNIDHINRNKSDNRWINLRVASYLENIQNTEALRINNKHGLPGVKWAEKEKVWRAKITVNSKTINLGRFKTKEEASKAYLDARASLHPFSPEAKIAASQQMDRAIYLAERIETDNTLMPRQDAYEIAAILKNLRRSPDAIVAAIEANWRAK